MKKILFCTLIVLFLVVGCGKVPKLENGQEAVVTLKGKDISVDNLYSELKENYALDTLINMIDTQILEGIYKSDESEDKYIESQIESIKYYYEQYYKDQFKSYEEYLTKNGVKDEAELKVNIALSYKRKLATEDYAKTLVTENDINKYYQDEIFGDITASHILIKPEYDENATDEVKAEAEKKAKTQAEEIITKLKNGEKFADLAKKYSDDTSAASGGTLAPFNKGQMVTEFEKTAKELAVGKYTTTPVKTQYGYHIILKTAQKEKPALKNVKNDIINAVANEKISEDENLQTKALIKLRKDNKVEIQDKSLKAQYDAYVSKY